VDVRRPGGKPTVGACVSLILEGALQDGPFLREFSRAAAGGAATLRASGAGIEARLAFPRARTRSEAVARARALVARAAGRSGAAVHVRSAAVVDGSATVAPGVHWLEPAPGGSDRGAPAGAVGADRAPCEACRREAAARGGRRHGYTRAECLACGPRFAHARGFPLTRAGYGLERFEPCAGCREESAQAGGRRFGSERVSCATCGPTLTLVTPAGPPVVRDAMGAAARLLASARPVAVSTPYGGVAVSALDGGGALRVAVGDEFCPFVVVVPSAAVARRLAALSAREAAALGAPEAPEVVAEVTAAGSAWLHAASPFEPRLRLRMPDCGVLRELTRRAGPLLSAGAARGGALWPTGPGDASAISSLAWLSDGLPATRPLPPHRTYRLGRRQVLLAHGRGSLPAAGPVSHQATVLSAGGGAELFGAVAHGGLAHFTGSAGPAQRSDSAGRLKALLSHAAALSPAARAARVDAVASAAAEGSPSRLMAEETADEARAPFVPVPPLRARAAAAQAGSARPPPALVLESEEHAGADAGRWHTDRTGGDLVAPGGARVMAGVAPYEVVESPGGRLDLLAPLASLYACAGAPLGTSPAEDEPILRVLRGRAQRSTSAVALADSVAAALGLVPRRAPPSSGLFELSRRLARPGFSRRFRIEAPLAKARGSRQVDALKLLEAFAEERERAARREAGATSVDTRAALGASFLRALLDGLAASCAAATPRPGRVVVTGAILATPPAAAALAESLDRRGVPMLLPAYGPVLDGALAYGAAEYAGTILT